MDSTDEGNLDHQGLTVAKYFEGRRREMTGRQFRVFQRASENLLETVAFSGALVVWQMRGRLTARVLATPIFFLHAAWSLGKKKEQLDIGMLSGLSTPLMPHARFQKGTCLVCKP